MHKNGTIIGIFLARLDYIKHTTLELLVTMLQKGFEIHVTYYPGDSMYYIQSANGNDGITFINQIDIHIQIGFQNICPPFTNSNTHHIMTKRIDYIP